MWHPASIQEPCLPNVHLDLPSRDLGELAARSSTSKQGSSLIRGYAQHSTEKDEKLLMQPYHAHVYFNADTRQQAEALHGELQKKLASSALPGLLFVGGLKEGPAGPHPTSQFEVHFMESALPAMRLAIRASGRTALIHPLTDDDLADHTRLAEWIGTPLELALNTLDPPGNNRGIARFGKSDF